MLRCIIFDFNGVIVDDEPLHLEMFQKVLSEEGISLSRNEYYARYLGMDDRGCFLAVFKEKLGRQIEPAVLSDLIRRKGIYYQEAIITNIRPFPGVSELLPKLASRYPLAVASGALRVEIELILKHLGLRDCFRMVISAENVSSGKPDPESFLKALEHLNEVCKGDSMQPQECLVIEDSRDGIAGAHSAGMKCVAITNSYPADELEEADMILQGLDKVSVSDLERLFT